MIWEFRFKIGDFISDPRYWSTYTAGISDNFKNITIKCNLKSKILNAILILKY